MNVNEAHIFIVILPVVLSLCFALFLVINRLNLSIIKKNIFEYGPIVINFLSLILFTVQKFTNTVFESGISIFTTDKLSLNLGFYIDEINVNFLIYSALTYLLVSVYAKIYFKNKKQFIFTKQRYYIFLSLLAFNTYFFFLSPNLFQTFLLWILQGVIIYVFSYFDIFKFSTNVDLNRFYRITLIGNFAFLAFLLIFFKYASLSDSFTNAYALEFTSINNLSSYLWKAADFSQAALIISCILITCFTRLFVFPFNCYYSFFAASSSNILYLTVATCANCMLGSYLFIKTYPYIELFSNYKVYFEIFIGLTLILSLASIILEKNLKIIFGHITSAINALFIICFLNFNGTVVLNVYFSLYLIVFFILVKLFLADKQNLNSKIASNYGCFVIERLHIYIFEKLLCAISSFFNFINEKIVKNITHPPVILFDYLTSVFSSMFIKRYGYKERLRGIFIIFALLIVGAILILLFGNF